MFYGRAQLICISSSGETLEVNVTFMLLCPFSSFPNEKQVVTEC